MSGRPFRFLQASDFHLDQPPHGLAEIPDHLLELLADSPYRAAARVFDLALAEKVDFVLLAGNLVQPNRAGPRGLTFLHDQFARLAEHRVDVYWAASASDARGDWPSAIRWPANVHGFASGTIERVLHSRDGSPLCQIAGVSVDRAAHNPPDLFLDDFARGADQHFTIGVVTHPLDATALADLPVSYWAFGGTANSSTPLCLTNPPRIAHASGSPQGRTPAEIGPHGCTLVCVDEASRIRLVSHGADAVRWHAEQIELDAAADRAALDDRIHERLEAIGASPPDRPHLVRWTIAGSGPVVMQGHRHGLAAELTAALRRDWGFRPLPVWTTAVEIEPTALPDELFVQETLLGDFLRAVRSREHHVDEPVDLKTYLSPRQQESELALIASISEPAARHALLRRAGQLGLDLLQPEPVAAKESAR